MTITRPEEIPDHVHAYWVVTKTFVGWAYSQLPDDWQTANNYVIVTEDGVWSESMTFEELCKQKMPVYSEAHLKYWVERR